MKRLSSVGVGLCFVGLFVVVVTAQACTGVIDEPGGGSDLRPPGSGPGGPVVRPDGSFLCDPNGLTSTTPMRRLSEIQFRNTVRDLFVPTSVDASSEASSEIDRVPVDDAGSDFRLLDDRLSEQHVRAYFRVADRLATAATVDDTDLETVVGTCALDASPTAACIDGFLDDFGKRAFRRPLTDAERARYHGLNDGARDTRELFRSLVFSILMAPGFLYHEQLEGEAIDGDDMHFELSAYELVSRLAYHFWQSMPDEELFAAADDGSILTEDGYATQLARVFDDPRTHQAVNDFYVQWFRLGAITTFPTTEGFNTFAEGTTIGESEADHLAAAADEIQALTAHFTWEAEGSFRDLLLTDLSFTRSPHLAGIYGVEPWDGSSDHPRLPAEDRAGLLTRVAFLVSGTHQTHPIHRGATIRRRILCEELPAPDPAALPEGSLVPPPVTADQTTRERYENKVQNEPCASCHTMMNPIGYVFERYDALGRVRDTERVIDEVSGEVLNELPVDSVATPRITLSDATEMSTGVELSEAVADSGRAEGCFARNYFRFAYGREETGDDGCVLERVRGVLGEGGTLHDALHDIALDPSFRSRRVQ